MATTTATTTTTTLNSTPATIEISGAGGGGTKIVQLNIGTAALLEGSVVKRHELLARQPSYCKILNELKEVDSEETEQQPPTTHNQQQQQLKKSNTPPPPANINMKNEVDIDIQETADIRQAPTVVINGQPFQIVTGTATTGAGDPIDVLSIANSGGLSPQYASTGGGVTNNSVFLPANTNGTSSGSVNHQAEEQARKREIRLFKNREAARECRNKKKEYIKCLENRVAVLENQNKALIEELKLLKELYKSQN
eukprot:TRINITY_DN8070_c0_g1_i3.p1 TRINITY_DN8070_c0_g1~~TRINITY_DN8070_c0_g1_i3.p1  ORF type:complete len:253 (+),score=62.27 TRINITY_DN8070_c0_g1_i3:138-896(+)